jgi:hypothetical protein
MLIRFFFILFGFGLSILGGISYIAYAGYFAHGISLSLLIPYLLTKPSLYFFPIGILIITLSFLFWE